MQGPSSRHSRKRAKVYPTLRDMCLNHQFWPHQQLQAENLASCLSSSATPVREALARLAGEGLIEAVPNRGYFAKTISVGETQSRIDILFLFLHHACSLGALKGSGLKQFFVGAESGDNAISTLTLAEETYTAIARTSENNLLVMQVTHLLDATRYIRSLDLEDSLHARQTREALDELHSNVKSGNLEAAHQTLRHQQGELQNRLNAIVREARLRMIAEPSESRGKTGNTGDGTELHAVPTRCRADMFVREDQHHGSLSPSRSKARFAAGR